MLITAAIMVFVTLKKWFNAVIVCHFFCFMENEKWVTVKFKPRYLISNYGRFKKYKIGCDVIIKGRKIFLVNYWICF